MNCGDAELRVLIVSLSDWQGPARLPKALKRVGCEVGMVCRRSYAAAKTRFVDRFFLVNPKSELETIRDVLASVHLFQPDLIVPATENAIFALYDIWQLHAQGRLPDISEETMAAVRRSIPDPAKHELFYNKIDLLEAMAARGVRIPPQKELHTFSDADAFIQEHGYPVLLKPNQGHAGIGIVFCDEEEALISALRERLRPGAPERWTIQKKIEGRPANHAFVSRDGRYGTGMSLDRLMVHPFPLGPSTVVRLVKNDEMAFGAQQFVELMGYNGFGSAQFMVEGGGEGPAYFIETNFRIGVMTHLGYLLGQDLCQGLVQTWRNRPIELEEPKYGLTVALYPQEPFRDPRSEYMSGTVDWVTDDPDLEEHFAHQIQAKWGEAALSR